VYSQLGLFTVLPKCICKFRLQTKAANVLEVFLTKYYEEMYQHYFFLVTGKIYNNLVLLYGIILQPADSTTIVREIKL
jgi:hypothetical protein